MLVKWRRKVKRRKNNERYTRFDFFIDLLLYVPELLLLPFRFLLTGIRYIFKFIADL